MHCMYDSAYGFTGDHWMPHGLNLKEFLLLWFYGAVSGRNINGLSTGPNVSGFKLKKLVSGDERATKFKIQIILMNHHETH